MGEALTAFAIFIFAAFGIILFLTRRTRDRIKEATVDDGPTRPRTMSKRQQRVVASLEPAKERPTIEQLVAEEAAATGVNEIPGGQGLDVSLKLRVYWRDEVVRSGCEDGTIEFRIEEGVDPEAANTDDVRLVCVRGTSVGQVASEGAATDITAEVSEEPDQGAPVADSEADQGS